MHCRNPERCLSGRKEQFAKLSYWKRYRGFESRPLRLYNPDNQSVGNVAANFRTAMLSYKHIKIYDAEGDLSKEWYVSFYFLKPVELQKAGSSLYKRFKIFESINTFKTVRSRRNQIKVVYNSIKELLENGFNPFTQFKYSKITGKYSISQCIDEYLERVKPDLKPKSYKLYDGRLKLFKVFLEESNLGDMDISHLTKQHIFDFVKINQLQRKWSNKTYNHYLQAINTFLQYYIDNFDGYLKENVCSKVKKFQVQKRGNRPFRNNTFKNVLDWLKEKDWFMYQFCRFIYYSCMRPDAELRLLQIKHIDLIGRKIVVPSTNSKSKITQYIPIDEEFFGIIREMNLEKYDREYFVFGLNDGPAEKPVSEKYFRKRFMKVRRYVYIDEHVTMYSFKHTRCIHLVEDGEKLHNIIKLTRHKTLVELMDYLKDMGVILGDEVKLKSRSI